MMKPAAGSSGHHLPFGFMGFVTLWDPIHRHLEIGTRHFSVAPDVAVGRLVAGVEVTVTGYVDRPATESARWIVTQLARG
jgi:hypothetical protein